MLSSGLFSADVLQQLVREHEGGQHDHSTPLWTLLMFDAFLARESGVRPSRPALGMAA